MCQITNEQANAGTPPLPAGVISQYTRFVKPMFDTFIGPSRKEADVIIPWSARLSSSPFAHSFSNTNLNLSLNPPLGSKFSWASKENPAGLCQEFI